MAQCARDSVPSSGAPSETRRRRAFARELRTMPFDSVVIAPFREVANLLSAPL